MKKTEVLQELVTLKRRVELLQKQLKQKELKAFLVSNQQNRHYLSGWESDSESGYLLFTQGKNYLLTDSRYSEAAAKIPNFELIDTTGGFAPKLADVVHQEKLTNLGFESHDLSVFDYRRFRKILKTKLVPVAHLVENLRAVKDKEEFGLIKRAVDLDEKAFKHMLGFVRPGLTEAEIAWELEKKLKDLGAERMAWSPLIVASGVNSSIPHYGNSPKVKIKKGDTLQLDFGCVVSGYHSDTSRVIFVGKPSQEQVKTYNLVRQAQELGESLVKPGVMGQSIDQKVREFLKKRTDFFFTHGLGHGVGLAIHELPRLSPAGKQKLEIGNCITVEPGIYQPGWGGMRLEDIVVVTKNGCEILTKTAKNISEITV